MADVIIRPCSSYEPGTVKGVLKNILEISDYKAWLKPGMTVGIKTNLVSMMKPEAAATTHPVMLAELTGLLAECGANVIVGDSPGGLYTAAYLERVYTVTGLKAVEAAGGQLNRDFSQKKAFYKDGAVLWEFVYTGWLDKCDVIIDFCKLKTHGMMGLSAAAKNMFGVIPGTIKPEYHYRFPNPQSFSDMILDLDTYFRPKLCICDGVIGMEGNGPTQGTPRKIGVVLAAENPHKLDLLAATLIGIAPGSVPTLEAAFRRGFAPRRVEELTIDGEWKPYCVPDYIRIEHYNSTLFGLNVPGVPGRILAAGIKTALQTRPGVQRDACVGCGKCRDICPAKAITMKNNKPHIAGSACICCFCCQEFCPVGAMKARRPAIARLLGR